jgi:hypothetical protein
MGEMNAHDSLSIVRSVDWELGRGQHSMVRFAHYPTPCGQSWTSDFDLTIVGTFPD